MPACPSSLSQPTCLPLPARDPLQGGKASAKINGHVQGARGRAGPLGLRYLGAPGVLSAGPAAPSHCARAGVHTDLGWGDSLAEVTL